MKQKNKQAMFLLLMRSRKQEKKTSELNKKKAIKEAKKNKNKKTSKRIKTKNDQASTQAGTLSIRPWLRCWYPCSLRSRRVWRCGRGLRRSPGPASPVPVEAKAFTYVNFPLLFVRRGGRGWADEEAGGDGRGGGMK